MAGFDQLGIYRDVARTPRTARNARTRRAKAAFQFPGGGVPNANQNYRTGFVEVVDDSPYQIESPEQTILVHAENTNVITRLPLAEDYKGARVLLKKTNSSSRTVSLDGSGTETIDGELTRFLISPFSSFKVMSQGGTNWILLGEQTFKQRVANTVVTVTNTNYDVSAPEQFVLVTTGGSNRIITLPDNTDYVYFGIPLTIKKIDSGVGAVRIEGTGALIDGLAQIELLTQWDVATLVGLGGSWKRLNQRAI